MIDIIQLKANFESDTAGNFDVEQIRNKYLSRKHGLLTQAFEQLASLTGEEKKQAGQNLNFLKNEIDTKILNAKSGESENSNTVDLSLPPLNRQTGHLHPLTQVQKELEDIFKGLGFGVVTGPEIESDFYNFTALNFPENHPARDMQDTFFVNSGKEKLVMRTHTSPMQVRFMEKHKPPFNIIVPGTVYRNEATDATHEHTFDQMEGLVVGENISFAQMSWTFDKVLKKFFGPVTKIKLVPSYFPFVEPGAEVAISNPNFKNGQWLEILGCGMVHQSVFEAAGYPKNKYTGFAFGFGLTRFALMKNLINDIRLLRENDLRFLKQF